MSRFILLEPSKVGTQHITLLEGYLRAIAVSRWIPDVFRVEFHSSDETYNSLSYDVRAVVPHRSVKVMNGERRRLARKSILEWMVVARAMVRMRRDDVLLVTCVLPPALIGLELLNRILGRGNVVIMLHGEVEGLFDNSLQRWGSFGFWISKWMQLRKEGSKLSFLVIDDFIKRRLVQDFGQRVDAGRVFVAYHPLTPYRGDLSAECQPSDPLRVAFIGYRTRFKGFEVFQRLARSAHGVEFVAVGGGVEVNVATGAEVQLADNQAYMNAIAGCAVAFFPYSSGYTCSLSAALLDALSAGLHVVATKRPCFVSMADYLGPDFVTLVDDPTSAGKMLSDREWICDKYSLREQRLSRLAASRYGLDGVRECLENLLLSVKK
jgi:hypothetical protein